MSAKLRLLVLDDNPTFTDSVGCVSLSSGCAPECAYLLRRNYEIQWLYEPSQMRDYYRRARHVGLETPEALLNAFKYPHVILFDYDLREAHIRRGLMKTNAQCRDTYRPLNPLDFKAVNDLAPALDGEPDDWEAPGADLVSHYQGCFAGSLIALTFSDLASVGIPQTAHRGDPQTAFFEWILSDEMQGAFDYKSQLRSSWFEFLAKALPRFRNRMLKNIRAGKIIPELSSFETRKDQPPQDSAISFTSAAGVERMRIEAMFFDLFYQIDAADAGTVEMRDLQASWSEVGAWMDEALSAAIGADRRWSSVRAAVRLAERFQTAFTSQQHERRRKLSRELFTGSTAKRREAVQRNSAVLAHMGVDPEALLAKNGHTVTIASNRQSDFGVLGSLKDEAENEQVARYAAIALMVWAEMVWVGITDDEQHRIQNQLLETLSNDDELLSEVIERLDFNTGLLFSDNEFKDLKLALMSRREGHHLTPRSQQLLRVRLTLIQQIAGLDYSSSPIMEEDDEEEEHEDGATKAKRRPKTATDDERRRALMRDVMAPTPAKLALWRELRERRAEVDKPLMRLAHWAIGIQQVMDGRRHPDDHLGLRRGEGRLIKLFATHYSFPERQWPLWMREGAQW